MQEKIVIIGASHGGHEAAIELLDKYQGLDVTIYEAGGFVSFMSCGMKLFLEQKTTGINDVRNFAPEDLEARGGKVVSGHEVVEVNPQSKQITVKNIKNGELEQVHYDKLIISSGVNAANLPVPGNDLANIYLMRGYEAAQKIDAAKNNPNIKNVVVIGAGNGINAVEVMEKYGKNVTLIDAGKRPLENYLPEEFTNVFASEMEKHHVNLMMETKVESFTGENGQVSKVVTDKGEVAADLVIIAAGIKPATDYLDGAIELNKMGYIQVDDYFRTSAADVYAIGDAIWPFSIPANTYAPNPSAVAARHEAQYLVDHLFEAKPSRPFPGLVGAQVLEVFDAHAAITGLNLRAMNFLKIDAKISIYKDRIRPAYIPEDHNTKVLTYLIYNKASHQILGGGVLGGPAQVPLTNVLSLAIRQKLTLEDLVEQDFFFSPSYDRQWNLLNLAAKDALEYKRFDR